MKTRIGYIPNEEEEEESLLTAKVDSEIEKLRKRRDERTLTYTDEEKDIKHKIQIESSLKS
ncbi:MULTISPECIES: hypothetical protein [Acinetobacter calcoaceticus/baumannii complex]|uniref:Uncharacterized protein n=2 Tax=Acinetobacter calcoaceticus/baumannii complex TaxID=909768 RepID=A0AB35K3W1_9GAMM|nr:MULTISPECIES: hypothetical protein [Acinetobacter calcoaceticus/baumannii complex]MCG6036392.1 hypothetical protein [Acinetobacter baumannii]RJE43562.1 hypothetical protein AMS70_09160 [Acinetobacter sp. JS678]MDD9317194.1 hypothetical protein [Acinetobacter lactucae]MDD9321323.1 hypothetical protein [Acinetobacter lactucae]MDR6794924.1 hypothetical protein [Acinetobacter calcoaceticus]